MVRSLVTTRLQLIDEPSRIKIFFDITYLVRPFRDITLKKHGLEYSNFSGDGWQKHTVDSRLLGNTNIRKKKSASLGG